VNLTRKLFIAAIATAVAAVAQNPITADSPFQVKVFTNLNAVAPPAGGNSGSIIDISNTGAQGAALYGPGFGTQPGNLCVDVYAFSPDEEMNACCSCYVTPNGAVSLDVNKDLAANPANGVVPKQLIVKLVSTLAGAGGTGGASACNQSAANIGTATIVPGMVAWGTTLHLSPVGGGTYVETETAFTPATLSAGETASLANRCTNIIGNLSGAGQCNSCKAGVLGASKL